MFSRMTLLPLALLGISAFFYTVQAAPTAIGTRGSTEIDTLGGGRVKRQGGGCGCCGGCGCGCCGCGGGGGGCGCCCCRPQCCCQKCCTCCKTCCCTRCCTCCRPCCCGCGCGCCGCGGGRKRRALQNLRIRLADKKAKRSVEVSALPAAYQEGSVVEQSAVAQQEPVILPLDFKSEAENAQE